MLIDCNTVKIKNIKILPKNLIQSNTVKNKITKKFNFKKVSSEKKKLKKKTIKKCITPPSDLCGKCGKNILFSFLPPYCFEKNILFFSR